MGLEAGVPGPGSVETLGAVGGLLVHDVNCLAWSDQAQRGIEGTQ